MGWLGLAVVTFPLKLYFFQSVGDAIEMTLMREGFGFVLTCASRDIWKHYWNRIERKPVRQILLVIIFALLGSAIDLLLMLLIGHQFLPPTTLEPRFLTASFCYRALILTIWGLMYFGLKGIQARQQMALAMREAELRMLRTQISPHFFFNALNTMLACTKKDSEALPGLIQSLANYLRYTLKHHEDLFVPLKEEYEAVLDYLTVEKARFREDLHIDSHLDASAGRQSVPGILLQPLLENAVKHGRSTSPRPLRIRIRITQPDPQQIEILVANTGQWRQTEPPHGFGIGLKNLRHRLQLAYPRHEALTITEADGWVCVLIRLPVRAAVDR